MIYDFVFYVWNYLRAALKICFLICGHQGTTYFLSFPCIIRKRQQRKNVTKALAFTRLFPPLIGHFLVPKTHYFQNEAKCKTFHKKWFPYKGFVLSLSLKQRLKTTRKWPVCVENNENQQGLHYCLHWEDAAPIRVKAKFFVEFRLENSPYFWVFKYARAVKQKVWNEAENSERDWGPAGELHFTPHFTFFSLILRKNPTVLQSM